MAPKKLILKQFSPSGEVINVINFLSGRITVLRGYEPSDLAPYQRAFSGTPGPERINLSLNGEEYRAEQNILIGFGESNAGFTLSVSEALTSSGFPENQQAPLLLSFGIENTLGKSLSQLGAHEYRLLQLLCAVNDTKRAIVLNNPFEPIQASWRERIAEHISRTCRLNQSLIVVTSMNYRPESWIDNEIISRVQVGENLKRTIGFGPSSQNIQNMIQQVRKDHHTEKEAPKPAAPTLESSPLNDAEELPQREEDVAARTPAPESGKVNENKNSLALAILSLRSGIQDWIQKTSNIALETKAFAAEHPKFTSAIFSATIAVSLLTYVGVYKISDSENENGSEEIEVIPTPAATKQPTPKRTPRLIKVEPPKTTPTKVPKPIPTEVPRSVFVPNTNSKLVLDHFPPSIKSSVLASFSGTISDSALKTQKQFLKATKSVKSPNEELAKDLLSALSEADGTGEKLPDSPSQTYPPSSSYSSSQSSSSPPNFANMSKEERRELMREKFREAIERAARARSN